MSDNNLPELIHEQLGNIKNNEETAEELINHLDDISDIIDDLTADTREGNVCYAQSHVLQRTADLLRELHKNADDLGDREAEIMALAIILDSEADETVY